eukprot:Phypoly_transcript_13990.p1 GENE.Phypoly_transcript_13990~~Phypoly_transcript_13990.p1  ORF type:complete len:180 (+),score=18.90 Phypoly_transcript_13990:132-671(+)
MAGLQVIGTCLMLCMVIALCYAGCGSLSGAGGAKYDLDPLTAATDYQGKEESTTYTYYYNFCQNIRGVTCPTPNPAAQVSATGTCTPIGLLPATSITEEGKGNIKIVYTNNQDLCGNPRTIPRITTLNLACSSTTYQLVSILIPFLLLLLLLLLLPVSFLPLLLQMIPQETRFDPFYRD